MILVYLSHQERPCLCQRKDTERAYRPCQCMQQSPFLNQPPAFKPCQKINPASKRAASGPFLRSSPSKLKISLHCRVCFQIAKSRGYFDHGKNCIMPPTTSADKSPRPLALASTPKKPPTSAAPAQAAPAQVLRRRTPRWRRPRRRRPRRWRAKEPAGAPMANKS